MSGLTQVGVLRFQPAIVAMIACDVLIMVGLFINKIVDHYPLLEYAQLLATWQFGVVRRGLVGQLWSLFHDRVAASDVYFLGSVLILLTIAMFLYVFATIFRFSRENMPLFAYVFGSPFFFKNFVFTIGYFDILGCLVALVALALPLNAVFLPIVGAGCIFLLFVHHLHFLLYIPAIGLIVLLRQRACGPWNPIFLGQALVLALVVGSIFAFLAFFARPSVTPDVFLQALRDRALDPVGGGVVWLWYSTIAGEMSITMSAIAKSFILRIPIYAMLIALHAPLIAYFHRMMLALEERSDFFLVLLGLGAITAGYLVICVVVFDYGRWVSNWAVCMMLVMFAVRLLPSRKLEGMPIALTPGNTVLATIVTVIPRVGITKPF